jgi:hypothetical protein
MKKLVLTATLMLATSVAFAASSELKSISEISSFKKNIVTRNRLNNSLKVDLIKPINCDSNIDTGIFVIVIVWDC